MCTLLDQKNKLFTEEEKLTGTKFSHAAAEVGGIFWIFTNY